ncbi:GntR family transcriptional regulator [Streptomyces sp. T1317-0309]|nr:GntR family transcriptional regulator [Streptomyces sp. T1317-0309]
MYGFPWEAGTRPRGTYQVICPALRERVVAGTYREGPPSEAEIRREFRVARTTVRCALSALEESGTSRPLLVLPAGSPGPHRTSRS